MSARGWRGLGEPRSPRRNPASFQPATWARSRAPRPNLALAPGRPARPWPARAPLTAGPAGAARLHGTGAAAAVRAPGRRGIPGLSPARRGPRAQDGLRALPARPWQLACAPSRTGSGPPPGRAAAAAARAPPSGREGAGVGREVGRRGGRFLEGRALPTGGAGTLSRPPPAAPSPWLARPSAPGSRRRGGRTPGSGTRGSERSRSESEGPNVRGWDSADRSAAGSHPPWPASPEPRAPPSCEHRTLRAADAGTEGWAQPGPAGPQRAACSLDPQIPALRPRGGGHRRARFWAVLSSTRTAVSPPPQ